MNRMNKEIDSIILGDNQFFGVNHMSEAKGMERREQFKDIKEIKKMLCTAMELGVKGVFFSTHPDIYQITDMMREDDKLREHFNIYVNVPYIVKYMSMINTMGMVGTVEHILKGKNAASSIKFFAKGAKNLLTTDYIGLAMQLVEIEVAPFHDLNVKSVLLHNSLCDLAMAYGMHEVIKSFDDFVNSELGVIPGYGTQNYPLFANFLKESGVENAFVMTAINKMGFYMNPSREAYEKCLSTDNNTVLAMASLASGRLKPEEAYSYLGEQNIQHVVVGLSSREHAEETFGAIRKYILK